MKEVKLLTVVLAVVLTVSWFSYAREDDKRSGDKVTVLSVKPAEIRTLRFVTNTQTVAMSRQKSDSGDYTWFTLESKTSTRAFVGNDKVEELIKDFAPFGAIRSLGKSFDEKGLEDLKLKSAPSKLVIGLADGDRVFDIGGRTYGARDYYLRGADGTEVFLIAGRVLNDLEHPEGRFMQRSLRAVDLKDVAAVTISAGGKQKKVLHKNRLSPQDAFWADDAAPDQRSETLENYLDKLEKLSVVRYGYDSDPLPEGKVALEISWHDESGEVVEHMSLAKAEVEGRTVYVAKSRTTHRPVEVTKTAAEGLDKDLSVVFGD